VTYKTVGFLFNAVGGGFLAYGFGRDLIDIYEAQAEGNTTLACFRAAFAVSMALFSHPKIFPCLFPNRPVKPWVEVQQELVRPDAVPTALLERFCFIVKENGEFLMMRGRRGAHPDLAQGSKVLAAGEFEVRNGQIRWFDNNSGSFHPHGLKARDAAARAFAEHGLGNIVPKYREIN